MSEQQDRYSVALPASRASSAYSPCRTTSSSSSSSSRPAGTTRSHRVIGTFQHDQQQPKRVPIRTNAMSGTSTSTGGGGGGGAPPTAATATPNIDSSSSAGCMTSWITSDPTESVSDTVRGTCGTIASKAAPRSPMCAPSSCLPSYSANEVVLEEDFIVDEDDEDPHERIRSATTASAFVTFLKALFGVSLLFQPRILGETGLVLGTLVHVVIISSCAFACYLLLMARFVAIETKERKTLEEEHRQRRDELLDDTDRHLAVGEGTARSKTMPMPLTDRSYVRTRSMIDTDPYRVLNDDRMSRASSALALSERPGSAASNKSSVTTSSTGSNKTNKDSTKSDGGPFFGMKDRFITYSDLVRQVLGKKSAALITSTVFILHILFAAGMVASATRNLLVLAGWHITNNDEEEYEYEPDPGRRLGPSEDEAQDEEEDDDDVEFTVDGTGHLALTALLFPVVLKLLLIRNLAGMFLVSAMGLIAYFVGCVGSMAYSAMTFSEWEGGADAPEDMWDWKWAGIPTYVASTVYAIEGIQLALPTANNIEDPRKTVPLVSGAVFIYGLLTIAVAWVGYIGGLGGGRGTRHGENGCYYISYCLSSPFLTMVHELSLSLALLLTLPVILYPATELLEMWVAEREAAREARMTEVPSDSNCSCCESSWWSILVSGMGSYSNRIKVFSHDSDKRQTSSREGETDYVDMDAPGYSYPTDERQSSMGSNSSFTSPPKHAAVDTPGIVEGDTAANAATSPRSAATVPYQKHPADVISAHFWPRLGLALAVCTIGALEQQFYAFFSFARGVLLSFAGFIVPPALYFFAVRAERKINPWMMALLTGLVMFGVFTMILAFIPHFTDQKYMTMDVDEGDNQQESGSNSRD